MCLLCFATSIPMHKTNPCLKWSTVFFSFCCLLAGVLVITTSLLLSFKTSFSYVFFNDNNYYGALLAVGVTLTIVGLFGCIGALAENNCLLFTFSLFALLLIAGEITAGVLVYKNAPDFREKLQLEIKQGVELDYGENTTVTTRIDFIQRGWKCCGVNSPLSWSKSKYGGPPTKDITTEQRGTYFVPESCCVDEHSQQCSEIVRKGIRGSPDVTHLHREGCLPLLSRAIEQYSQTAYIVLTAIILCQLIAMILALIMGYQLGKLHRRDIYMSRDRYEVHHQASAPMLSSATSMESHKMFGVSSTPSSVHVSKSSLNLEPTSLEIPKSSLV